MKKFQKATSANELLNWIQESQPTASDPVNHPDHYRITGEMEVIDIIKQTQTHDEMTGFYLGNVKKYIFRHKRKNGLEDLKKARWYLDKLIELWEDYESSNTNRPAD